MLLAQFAALYTPWSILVLFVLAVALLESERHWARSRRRQGLPVGTLAYLLDVLSGLCGLLAAVGLVVVVAQLVEPVLSLAAEPVTQLVGQLQSGAPLVVLVLGAVLLLAMVVAGTWATGRRMRRRTLQQAPPVADPPPAQPEAVTPVATRIVAAPPLADGAPVPTAPPPPASGSLRPALVVAPSAAYQAQPEREPARLRYQAASAADDLPPLAMLQRKSPERRASAEVETGAVGQGAPRVVAGHAPWWRVPLLVTVIVGAVLVALWYGYGAPQLLSPGELQHRAEELTGQIWPAEARPLPALTPAAAPTDGTITRFQVSTERLNLRASPGANQPIVATLVRGDEVVALDESVTIRTSTWIKVRYAGVEGWVNRAYLAP